MRQKPEYRSSRETMNESGVFPPPDQENRRPVPETNKKKWLCGQAWGSYVLQADNRVKPCCRFSESWDIGDGSANTPTFRRLREKMLAGEIPSGCRKCQEEENAGAASKRQRSDYLLPKAPSEIVNSVKYLEINVSNLCNLRCIMCSPDRSSGWNRDATAAGYQPIVHNRCDLRPIRQHFRQAKTISLLGGETFLGSGLEEMVDLILAETNPSETALALSTNLTIFPSEHLRRKLERFKKVDLDCSIDAVGKRNDYIRFPSDWRRIEENFRCFRDWAEHTSTLRLHLSSTVSAYSFGGLLHLLEWWKNNAPARNGKELHYVWLNPVTTPEFQSVYALSRKVREELAAKLLARADLHFGNVLEAISYSLQGDRPELRTHLHRWTENLDRIRGVSARDSAPEIYSL